jgi:hypothetical protein
VALAHTTFSICFCMQITTNLAYSPVLEWQPAWGWVGFGLILSTLIQGRRNEILNEFPLGRI